VGGLGNSIEACRKYEEESKGSKISVLVAGVYGGRG